LASFDKFAAEEEADAAINLTVPQLKNIVIPPAPEVTVEPEKEIVIAEFTIGGKPKRVELAFAPQERLSVGRTKENALIIEDTSISKIHAALFINNERKLTIADTGSTNGTFINDKRIAYGKAYPISEEDKIKFGTVAVALEYTPREIAPEPDLAAIETPQSSVKTEQFAVNPSDLPETKIIENAKPLPQQMVTLKPIAAQTPAETAIKKPMIDLKPIAPPPTPEKSPDLTNSVEISNEKTLPNIAETDLPKDEEKVENANNTAQGIVFDFGENK
jgi:hypothetical protein